MKKVPSFTLVATFFLFLSVSSASAETKQCNLLPSGSAAMAGFGASWDVFSSSRELLINIGCQSNTINVKLNELNPNNQTRYLYHKGYYYVGSQWKEVDFRSAGEKVGGAWLSSTAEATIPYANLGLKGGDKGYVVAYFCTHRGQTVGWKCGCQDQACANSSWQIQQFAIPSDGRAESASTKRITLTSPTRAENWVVGGEKTITFTDTFEAHTEAGGNPVLLSLVPEDRAPTFGYTINEKEGILKVTDTSMTWKVGYSESRGMFGCKQEVLPAGKYRLKLYAGPAHDPIALAESSFIITLVNP